MAYKHIDAVSGGGDGTVSGPAVTVERAEEILHELDNNKNTVTAKELKALCKRYIKTMGDWL
jgi:6-phosphogluconate dehydrogenase